MVKQKIAQFILDNIVSSKQKNLVEKIKFKILVSAKEKILSDELVNYYFEGKTIRLPLSHDLSVNRTLFPFYSDNIGRIASYLLNKYTNLKAIDIGANIGDTVFIIKSKVNIPILCIEGDKKYFSLLERNISYWDNVYTENCFVGSEIENAGYVHYKGSGRIVEGNQSDTQMDFKNLSSIIESNPLFRDTKFIKIDTDGFDCRIIRSEIELLKKLKPVIFFEYDTFFLNSIKDDGLSVFDVLYEAGYNKMIIYENTGEYFLSVELNQKQIIEDIHKFYSGRKGERYSDICIFPKEDNDLANLIRKKELEYFSSKRI